MIENTPMVIDRYRATTAALGYTGDSVINSLSDIVMMVLGFLLARKLPVWAAIALLVVLEADPVVRHPRQSDAQRLDAACAQPGGRGLAGGAADRHRSAASDAFEAR